MQEFIETVFGNQFFQLPFLEALSYIVAVLLVGAIIVSLTRRALGMAAQPSHASPKYAEQPPYEEWEWRKAA
jgi:branched-subunit amino acid ABC-type transport system permease component